MSTRKTNESGKTESRSRNDDEGNAGLGATPDGQPDIEARERELQRREQEIAEREAAIAPRERGLDRSQRSRSYDGAEAFERQDIDVYRPPSLLEVPADGEYEYRWVSEYVNGQYMPRQVQERLREGYERVTTESLPEDFLVDEDVYGDGYARTTGLLLMRIPRRKASARRQYYRKQSRDRLQSVNELQGVAGGDAVKEDRGSRSLSGAEAGRALKQMSTS
jgi:hypothetical protein